MGTNDDVSTPAIVMIAKGVAGPLMLPANADLGRVIKAAGATHEVADERMSRDHATVRWERGTWTIRDLESRNGTFVNGERIHRELKRRGDVVVRLGHTIFVLVANGQGHPGFADGSTVVGAELARVYDQIRQLAGQGSGLLMVQGGPGSGKQSAARVYHAASPRSGPFVAVSCLGIQGVADRLIFGGRRGVVEMIGQLQMARGGTLYLAGIGDLDPAAQASLVKLLAQREAGDVDTNIVCSGVELRLAVADAQLADRLAACAVVLPPLRARRVELIRLMQLEVEEAGRAHATELELHARLIEACAIRPWPGNVRELRAAVAFAATRAIAAHRKELRPEDLLDTAGLSPETNSAETSVERKSGGSLSPTPASLAETMQRANGSLAVAARMLNLHRTQLAKLLDDAAIPYSGLAHDD